MLCKICKYNPIETTDGRCEYCTNKMQTFYYPNITNKIIENEEITTEDEKNFYEKVYKTNL